MSKKIVPVAKILKTFLEDVEQIKMNPKNSLPSLSPELRKEAEMIAKGETDELSDELYEVLFNSEFAKDMPYGTAKARAGDPYKWIVDKLRKSSGSIAEGDSETLEEDIFESAKTVIEGLALLGGAALGLATLYYGYQWGKEKAGDFADMIGREIRDVKYHIARKEVINKYQIHQDQLIARLLGDQTIIEALKTNDNRKISNAINKVLTPEERKGLDTLARRIHYTGNSQGKATSALRSKLQSKFKDQSSGSEA